MLVDCQAQNVITVFCIETLAGCKETQPHPHTHIWMENETCYVCFWVFKLIRAHSRLFTYRLSSWTRCQLRRCGRWCPPPRSDSARYCGSHCHGNQTLVPTPGPAGESEKDVQKVRKVGAMTTRMLRASWRLTWHVVIRLQSHQSPWRSCLERIWARIITLESRLFFSVALT